MAVLSCILTSAAPATQDSLPPNAVQRALIVLARLLACEAVRHWLAQPETTTEGARTDAIFMPPHTGPLRPVLIGPGAPLAANGSRPANARRDQDVLRTDLMPPNDKALTVADHHVVMRSLRSLVTPVLKHALWYARLGLGVLPLHRPVRCGLRLVCSCGRPDCRSAAKHPFGKLTRNGVRDASKDPSVIAAWFRHRPFNIGIATGAISGIFVLDIDPRHDGDETLAALERTNGPLPDTWRFLTGGGGEHILFRHPGPSIPNSKVIGRGIDLRGDGGYIVAPPSRRAWGRSYEPVDEVFRL